MQAILVDIAAQALGAALVALVAAMASRLRRRWAVPSVVLTSA